MPRNLIRNLIILGAGILMAVFAVLSLYRIFLNLLAHNIWFNDFFAIWSFGKFLALRHAIQIYDDSVLHDFQMDLGGAPAYYLPCPYPPSFFILIYPLGLMSYYLAFVVWIFFSFSLYFIASCYKQGSRYAAVLVTFAPATIIGFASGQSGLLSSALIVGGFRLVASRPILSGILFGLASIKPQLGLLIPIALISARLWRTVAAAVVTIAVLVVASSVAFGWEIWPLWLAKLPAHADWAAGVKDRYNPTITASLSTLGVDLPVARTAQMLVAVIVAVIIWVCFRRGITVLATAALLVGTFLATPYAFAYDMPMVTNAVLAVIRDREQTNRSLTIADSVVLMLALIDPIIMVATWRLAVTRSLPLVLLFGLIVWRICRSRDDLSRSGSRLVRNTSSSR